MSPREFLTLALELQTHTSEAAWRTAVSRAYYAAFHAARRLLKSWGFQIGQADHAHVGVTRRLAIAGIPKLDTVARELAELRSKRNAADYDLDRLVSLHFAKRYVSSAQSILAILELDFSTQQPQAVQTIREYEQKVLRDVTWRSLN